VRQDRYHPALAPRRSPYRMLIPLAVVVLLGCVWSGLWLYASYVAEQTLNGWREREAAVGRIHTCAAQTIGGYPFRIEVRCTEPMVEIRNIQPAMAIKGADVMIVAQVWDPTLLISELTGPLTVSENDRPTASGTWALGQASLRGLPSAPERISIVFDKLNLARATGTGMESIMQADHAEIHGRIAAGSTASDPVLDVVLNLVKTTAPVLGSYTRAPIDADIVGTLHGLKDLTPKPWPERLRELQAANGYIEIAKARVAQGDVIAVTSGTLKLTARGRLDGELRVTVANLDQAIAMLGLDKLLQQRGNDNQNQNQAMMSPGRMSQFAPALGNLDKQIPGLANSLDRIAPGLGGIARGNAGSGIGALVGALGAQTELEGRKAVTLPIRFNDGRASVGPIPLGEVPALY
jgi:hypothetical protein